MSRSDRRRLRFRTGYAALALVLAHRADIARGAGFAIQEQSVRGVGSALAGESAIAEDASTVFFNPAGMTRLGRAQVQAGGFLIFPRADVDDRGTVAATPAAVGAGRAPAPVGGPDDDDPFAPLVGGNLFAALPILPERLDSRLWTGLGITAPFGLSAEYDRDWFGRYDSTQSELQVLDFAPSLAFAVTRWLSLGASLDVQYAQTRLESALPDPTDPLGPRPETDGELKIDGDDWSVGFTAGILLEPIAGSRIGVTYRQGVSHELEGDARFRGLTGPLASQNGQVGGSADLDLPDVVMVGVAQDVTDRLTLLAQLNWYGWSSFDEIRVKLDTGSDLVSPQQYEDSLSAMVGLRYRIGEALSVRTGFQYDETPTQNGFRSTRTPDADRYWIAAGLSYALGDHLVIDFSYAHIFLPVVRIDRQDPFYEGTPLASAVRTRARIDTAIDVAALQARYRF